VPNFVKIGQSVMQILQVFVFQDGFFGTFGPPTESTGWCLSLFKKFGYDQCSSLGNMNVSIFGTFGWKMPIHTPKLGFGAI